MLTRFLGRNLRLKYKVSPIATVGRARESERERERETETERVSE